MQRFFEWFSHLSVFLLLPAFFFYQLFTSLGYMPAFAGGYFSVACIVLLMPLSLSYIFASAGGGSLPRADMAYFGFLFLFVFIVLINRAWGADAYLLEWHLLSALQMFCVYIAFKGISCSIYKNRYKYILTVLVAAGSVIYLSKDGVFDPRSFSGASDSTVSYQGFALFLYVFSCLSVFTVKSRVSRGAIYLVLLYALYLNGARSEFAGFVFFITIFEVCKFKYKTVGLSLVALALLLVVSLFAFDAVEVKSNRVANLANLQEDNSSNVRNELSREGFEKILDSPLLGDYGNYEQGFYIHNVTSVWLDLGLLGFVYFMLLLLVPMARLFVQIFLKRKGSNLSCMVFSLLVSSFLLLVFGKYFTYLVAPAALGLYSGLRGRSVALRTGLRSNALKIEHSVVR